MAAEHGRHGLPLLLGDDDAGPFIYLSSFPPMDEEMERSFAHGHASDNWRISVRGTTDMGRDSYGQGQFRFQDGGVPYASDNYAWGPDGGFGIIMFADRRGFPINPVKESLSEKVGAEQRAVAEILGIDAMDPCPGAPAIATTLGSTARGHLNAGFESAASWPELVPGVRTTIALLGEPECGPVLLLIEADAGVEALPARRIGTEIVIALVDGSVSDGDVDLDQGSVRVDMPEADAAALAAGPDGAQVVAIVTDRRPLFDAVSAGAVGAWGDPLASVLQALRDQLVPAGA